MKITQAHVHMIGIGGIGMCGIAELLHHLGARVSGSDMGSNAHTHRLAEMGVTVHKGHDAEFVGEADVVVYSSAIKPQNVEFAEARRRKVPLIARAEALAELMRLKRGIAIAGTHGKTTTTSMTASLFLSAQADPTIAVGGKLEVIKSTAQLGKGEWMIAEADESDGSFSRLWPEVILITNIDNDHLDHYGTFENIQRAFYQFGCQIPFYGRVLCFGDDPKNRELFKDFPKKVLFYGFGPDNDFWLRKEGARHQVFQGKNCLGELEMPLPGEHNALNALASIVTGLAAGFSIETCLKGVTGFSGVERRFQFKREVAGVRFYDDYGHHPTEVKAVLQAFKERYPDRKVRVLFQPHRYSRTKDCWNDFLSSFSDADELLVLDIYPAGETPIEGIDASAFVKSVQHNNCRYIESKDQAIQSLPAELKEGDVFVTLGAGDVVRVGESIASRMD